VTFSEMTRCMTNGHGIETPANKIATAQATLGLAFRLGLRLPSFPEGTDQNLKDGIFNIVLNALSASALTVDETLDEVFGKASTDTDLTRIGIRVMVNQLRNAFAHNPWRPKWVIFPQYKKSYPIELDDGSKFRLTRAASVATVLSPSMWAGWNFGRNCCSTVKGLWDRKSRTPWLRSSSP